MKKNIKIIGWLSRLSIYAGVAALFGLANMAIASELKDIRIGEYDEFTRVVFEFTDAVAPQHFDDRTPGRLTVEFPNTQPHLIRKIPTDRSPRIDDAQLWQTESVLSAVLLFPFDRFRFDFFTLAEPNRIAIDIFPLKNAAPSSHMGDIKEKNQGNDLSSAKSESQPAPADEIDINLSPMTQDPPIDVQTLQKTSLKTDSAQSPVVENVLATSRPPLAEIGQPENKKENHISRSIPFAVRLQYFLMIGLVIIIIALLGLLVLIMFSRHKTKNIATSIGTNDYFKHQDEAIASLNTRIREQLKRYDEA